MLLRNLFEVPADGSCEQRVVAIGVAGAMDDCRAEEALAKWLPFVDVAVLFSGMAFERRARERSHGALLEMLAERGIEAQVVSQEDALGHASRGLSMFDALERIAARLLDRIPQCATA